jgi:hypothetical protein
MKLKYQISQTTDLEPQIIIERIRLKLEYKKYSVVDVTDSSIKFKERPWALMWNFEAVRRLDGGRFEIGVSGNGMSVNLLYYLNILPPLLALTALEFFTISDGVYEGSIFFVSFFFITGIIQTIISKGVAKEMLREILNEGV